MWLLGTGGSAAHVTGSQEGAASAWGPHLPESLRVGSRDAFLSG